MQSSVFSRQSSVFSNFPLCKSAATYLQKKAPPARGYEEIQLSSYATSLALMCSTRCRYCSARAAISLCGRLVSHW